MKFFTKASFLILLCLSLVFFNSCEKDEGKQASSDLIGTWTVKESSMDVSVGGVDLVTYLMTAFDITEAQAKIFADLFLAGEGGMTPTGTITIKDDNTYTANIDGEAESGTWAVSSDGETLTISGTDEYGPYSDDLTIVSLSSSQLVLSITEDSEEVDLDDDNVAETTMDFSITMTLTK
jgi:hypothetical protein